MAEPIKSTTNQATLRGLLPAFPYRVEVSANGGRTWSKALSFQTLSDTTPPAAVGNLQVSVVGSSFLLSWDAPTTDAAGGPLSDFADYVITVYPTGNKAAAIQETTKSTTHEFSIYQNRHFFGTPQGNLTFEVQARDLTLNHSTPVVVSASASPPVAFTINANPGPRAIEIYWSNQGVTTYYKIYRSTISGFAPDDATNLIGTSVTESADNIRISFWDIPPTEDTYYYKVVALDAFNNTAQSSNEVAAAADRAGGADDTPLNTPAAPTVAGGIHSVTVSHNLLDSVGAALGGNLTHFDVHIGTAAGFAITTDTLVGTIPVGGGATAEETFVWVVKSTVAHTEPDGTTTYTSGTDTVYVKVIAVNEAGGTTAPSAEASTTVKGGNATYFENAAIKNAHIANLAAEKLMANTAIVNNLTVGATLTIGAVGTQNGIIRSGNYATDASGKPTAGYELTNTTLKMYGSGVFNGTIEANAGWLQNLTVYGNLTIGTSDANGNVLSAGAIQSSHYVAGSRGWKISNGGDAEFSGATIRGRIEALSGYLGDPNVSGDTLTVYGRLNLSGGDVYAYYGTNRYIILDTAGLRFYSGSTTPSLELQLAGNAIFRGTLSGASGSFGTITSGTLSGTTIEGGTIRTSSSYPRIEMSGGSAHQIQWLGINNAGTGYVQQALLRYDNASRNFYVDGFVGDASGMIVQSDWVQMYSVNGNLQLKAAYTVQAEGSAVSDFTYRSVSANATYTVIHTGNKGSYTFPPDAHGTHISLSSTAANSISVGGSNTAGTGASASRFDHGHTITATPKFNAGTLISNFNFQTSDIRNTGWAYSGTSGQPMHWRSSDGVVYRFTSSERVKTDIQDFVRSDAESFIRSLRPRKWTLTENGEPGVGFVAEEVPPEAQILEADGSPIFYDQYRMLASLVGVVQGLLDRVEALEQGVARPTPS